MGRGRKGNVTNGVPCTAVPGVAFLLVEGRFADAACGDGGRCCCCEGEEGELHLDDRCQFSRFCVRRGEKGAERICVGFIEGAWEKVGLRGRMMLGP